ncbi:MAG TPA: cyclic nucleotide-binding domain-containing protein, partial [Polyangiaceae bacterium]|nr:cyclic nucleotide-binding domain-containing protein [Polyangiaceae bacterium]
VLDDGGSWAAFTDNGAAPRGIVAARIVMTLALCATVPTILGVSHGNRIFWTIGIAALPLFWVIAGFHVWRRICPLAVAGQLGRLLGRPGTRKLSGWFAEHYMLVQFAILWFALSLRLIATNGSAVWLSGFLIALVVAAAIISLIYGGKTWCNFICPVGVVEKIYTEPIGGALPPRKGTSAMTSTCVPCVACKKNCPDIDLEQGYWKELPKRGRLVYFAWPGVVVAFYVYYWLYAGDWDYYFSGSWAYERAQPATWLDDGFHFVAGIPRVIAAPLTLIVFGGISLALFSAVEALWARGAPDHVRLRVRHQMFAVAGFTAFVAFYFFAGQPSLRRLPEWVVRGTGAVVVFAAAAIFFRRFQRREAEHVQEKFAEKILKKWEWGEAPPSHDLKDIYLLHTERTKQRASRLRAYRETVRELVADGVVTRAELVILDSLRAQLGISDKDHQNVIDGLSAEDKQLFDPDALVRDEAAAIERLAVAQRAAVEGDHALGFLRHVARWRGTEHAAHALELLNAMGDRPELAAAREALLARPRSAVATVAALHDAPKELVSALEKLWSEEATAFTSEAFLPLCSDTSRYVRATVALILARFDDDASRAALAEARCDEDAMVRQAATRDSLTAIEKLVLLREVPLFAELGPSHLEELAAVVVERHFEPGEFLCKEGEEGDAVYLLVEGHVRVYTGGDGRPERALGELGPVAC